MIANGYFQRFFTMVFDVQREGMLKETNGMSEFTGRMQEQRNITLEEKHKQKEETNKQTNLNFVFAFDKNKNGATSLSESQKKVITNATQIYS